MITTTIKRSGVALAVAAFIPAAIGYADQRVGNYDFNYMTSGDQRSLPIQVFDDGKNTYFQFRAGDPIPAIFSAKSGTVKLLVPVFEGPYVRVTETAGQFALQLGKSQAQVFYVRGGRDDSATIDAVGSTGVKTVFSTRSVPAADPYRLVATVANPSTQNSAAAPTRPADSLEANSYATPARGDRVSWGQPETETLEKQVWFAQGATLLDARAKKDLVAIAQEAKGAASVTVVGRDDATEKEGLEKARANNIRDELLKAGIPAERIKLKIAVMGTPKDKAWPSDVRIERVVPNLIGRPDHANDRMASAQRAADMLVREKLLTREQANALLARAGAVPPVTPVVATAPVQVSSSAAVPADVPPSGFDFKVSDKTISGALKRWALATKYEVIWDAPPAADPLITADSAISATSMQDALDKVLTGLQKKGYDLQGTLYSNRVVRFSAKSL